MVKRAPGNVRYLGYFGENILIRSFTVRNPIRKFWLFELGSGPAEIIVVWNVMPRRFIPDEQARNDCGAGEHSVRT